MATQLRLQQPADSPGASLATETLEQIVKLSLVDLSPAEHQAAVFTYQLVCVHWSAVARDLAAQELFVSNSTKAGQLATVLKAAPEKEQKVHALVIEVEKKTGAGGRGQRVADLLRSCTKLERLSLTVADSLGEPGSKSGTLGSALRDRLAKLSLTELELHGDINVPAKAFREILAHHNSLRVLVAPTLELKNASSQTKAYGRLVNQLQRIQVSPGSQGWRGHVNVLQGLARCSSNTITHFSVGDVGSYAADILPALKLASSRLVELDVVGEKAPSFSRMRGYMEAFLPTLTSIRSLTIGYHSLEDLSKLFELLTPLATLEHFTLGSHLQSIYSWSRSNNEELRAITATTVSDYLTQAVHLKSLSLPRPVADYWALGDLPALRQTAEMSGVTFRLVGEN